jgi:dephospho-CoA kinase
MGSVGTDMRKKHGPAYFTDTFIARAKESGIGNVIMESIRTLAEAENINTHGGFVIGINAPVELRYARITERKSATDYVTFEQFREQEDAEYYTKDPTDPAQMNVLAVLAGADYTLVNDGTLPQLHAKIDEMLTTLASR